MKYHATSFNKKSNRLRLSKKLLLNIMVLSSSFGFCQTWDQLSNIGANITGTASSSPPSADALTFSLNDKIYVLGSGTAAPSSAQIWEYDPGVDGWTEKATYPGSGTSLFCGFVINGMIYAGCGTSGSVHATSDFYKYNPNTNTWTPVANVPGPRIWGVGFSIGSKGYITGGEGVTMGIYLKELWEYDAAANSWTQKANFPATARALSTSFSAGGSGYVGLGYSDTTWHNDLYRYNPTSDSWTQVTSFPSTGRCGTGCVSIGSTAVFLCGNTGMTVHNECYAYDASTDSWSNFISFGATGRSTMLCANVGNKIFAGGGRGSGGGMTMNDWWSLQSTVGLPEHTFTKGQVYVYRNSVNEYVLKSKSEEINDNRYAVYDEMGRLVYTGVIAENQSKIILERTGVYSIVFTTIKVPTLRFVVE